MTETAGIDPQVLRAAGAFGVRAGGGDAVRLAGGEESVAWRVGAHVVRVGPPGRSDAEYEWCHRFADLAASSVPEAVAPLRTKSGASVVRACGRGVTVWPFVAGRHADRDDGRQREQAAALLARLHRALDGVRDAAEPGGTGQVHDAGLDAFEADFDAARPRRRPVHGDFYRGNVLAEAGRIVAVIDWDEARIEQPEREVAQAAWEWGGKLSARARGGDRLEAVRRFVADYARAGGTAAPDGEVMLRQLIRARLRQELLQEHRDGNADALYGRALAEAFTGLRP